MTPGDVLQLELAIAITEATAATVAAIVFIYLRTWWRARARYLERQLAAEREANLFSTNIRNRTSGPGGEGEIITPG